MRNKSKAIVGILLLVALFMSLVSALGLDKAYALTYVNGNTWIDTSGAVMTAEEASQWVYRLYADNREIILDSYTGDFIDGEIVGKVPASINGLPVTSMYYTFRSKEDLVYAPELPSTVITIAGIFQGCSNLISAPSIPNSVISMYQTFKGCTSLTEAPAIPDSVSSMEGTFANCIRLKSKPNIPSTVDTSTTFELCTTMHIDTWIDTDGNKMELENALLWDVDFSYATNGYKISYTGDIVNGEITGKIPAIIEGKPVTDASNLFYNNTDLRKAPILPDSVINMSYTFFECTNLTEVPAIPDSATNMYRTFWGCTSLTEVPPIPDSVTSMEFTFNNCTSLEKMPTLGNSVKDMSGTFHGCTSLVEATTIPDSVINMSETFYDCISLIRMPNSEIL